MRLRKHKPRFHLVQSLTPTLCVQSASGWISLSPNVTFEEPTRMVVIFVSSCPVCCMAAHDDAYILGMN